MNEKERLRSAAEWLREAAGKVRALIAERDALAAEVAKLRAALGEVQALADRWEAQRYHSGAYYPEATAYDDGRDHQAEACTDDIRAVLDRHGVTAQPDTEEGSDGH